MTTETLTATAITETLAPAAPTKSPRKGIRRRPVDQAADAARIDALLTDPTVMTDPEPTPVNALVVPEVEPVAETPVVVLKTKRQAPKTARERMALIVELHDRCEQAFARMVANPTPDEVNSFLMTEIAPYYMEVSRLNDLFNRAAKAAQAAAL